jgi:hypothetical protein
MAVDNGIAYIESKLKSDNEKLSDFQSNSVIDAYDLAKKQYLFSFYIPKTAKERIFDFKVNNRKLYVLYGNRFVTYSLKP